MNRFGGIDVLVNNAGQIQVGPVQDMTLGDFEQAMDVMFWGVVYPTRAVLPYMLERRAGRIVNITSIGGKVAVPHLLPYDCAKFAAMGFSEGLRAEMLAQGIKVVTIAPGLMRTGSYRNAIFKGDAESESAWFGVSASMPGITIEGSRAARQIVSATRRGDAELILTTPAQLLARFHGMFPGATAEILGLINQLLPAALNGKTRKRGADTRMFRKPLFSALTILGRMAARRYLQP
jgi:short-subunit dehydrogenase